MTDELIDLMEMILVYHEKYQDDFQSFNARFNFELCYWLKIKQLNILIEQEFKTIKPFTNRITKMKSLPSEERPSTKLLRDLYKDREKLIEIESSNEPYVSKIRSILQKDYWLSHALIKFLNYEYDLGVKIKNKKTENKSAI